MPKKILPFILVPLVALSLVSLFVLLVHGKTIDVLQPRGVIADQQRQLMIIGVALAAIGVIPTFIFAAFVAVKYRASNSTSDYRPDWHGSRLLSGAWWLVLVCIIGVLGVIEWGSTHQLDPYKPIVEADAKPMTIQVVALQWKWLFIYPDQNIATVNQLAFPVHTPVTFQLTADAPMNSFWIPQLGGQTYAMPGMINKLNLMADTVGNYAGSDAEISGEGFADMKFTAKAMSQSGFDAWVASIRTSRQYLDLEMYNQLAKPSHQAQPLAYFSRDKNLYDTIVMKYMTPASQSSSSASMDSNGSMAGMSGM